MAATARVQRQEIILTEMINRIKKYSGMRSVKKSAKTLLLVVSKFDVWKHLLDMEVPKEPWMWEPDYNTCVLDVDLIKNVSFCVRQLLLQHVVMDRCTVSHARIHSASNMVMAEAIIQRW